MRVCEMRDMARSARTNVQRTVAGICLLGMASLFYTGCSTGSPANTPAPAQTGIQTYLAPAMEGATSGGLSLSQPQTYTLDDNGGLFKQSITGMGGGLQGTQVLAAGSLTKAGARGLLEVGVTTTYSLGSFQPVPSDPAQNGWAVELPNQAGGFAQLEGQPAVALGAALTCPSSSTAKTYQFVTLPAALSTSGEMQSQQWNPMLETAYGSVDISAEGSTVNLANIKQFTLPSTGTGAPANPAPSSASGACSSTFYGQTITLPAQLVITDPGSNTQTQTPAGIVSIGPTGMLVGSGAGNILGAGTGEVGLPRPSSPIDSNALASQQYLGFVYGAGAAGANSNAPTGWTSTVASFGFTQHPACPTPPTTTGATIYGGDFLNNDPSTSTDGFGNCDLAIDLGPEDSSNNGLFPNATVWMWPNFVANTSKTINSVHAVAIAGQLNSKYAIFLIGVDSRQPWGLYLLPSN